MLKHTFKYILLVLVSIFGPGIFSATLVLEGVYQNENLFVQNAFSSFGVGYCVYEIRINGEVTVDEVNSSAFEIDFSQRKLSYGQPITIAIKHRDDGCIPKVLNPEVIEPKPTFETSHIRVSPNGLLTWTTENETSSIPFIVEQYVWKKWVKIGEVQGKGKPLANRYSFQTTPISGVNKFRVKQRGYIDQVRYSPSVTYHSLRKEVSYVINQKKDLLEFSEFTSYEVYDKFGDLIKKGFSNRISLENLTQNEPYYLNYGNTSCAFELK